MKTLGALALGVFFSCAPNSPEALYPQNRNVLSLTYRDLTKGADDSIRQGTYPKERSGWRLAWALPEGSGLNGIYIFADTIPEALAKSKLISGAGAFDSTGLPKLVAHLSPTDTSWEIPSSFFANRKQGRFVRSDTAYFFSVWLRYDKDVAGLPVTLRVYLGDETPPILPVISDSAGQTTVVLRIPRPLDQVSVFDTVRHGPLSRVKVLWWPGNSPADSVRNGVSFVDSVLVSGADLKDQSLDTYRLEMKPLRYFTSYMYTLVVTDSVGLTSYSTSIPITTRDSLPPTPPSSLTSSVGTADTAVLTWTAATDTFASSGAALSNFPNYHIASYTIQLDGFTVDSLDLTSAPSGSLQTSTPWAGTGAKSRFKWTGSNWQWTWPNLRPGKRFSFSVYSRDISGNVSQTAATDSGAATSIPVACPAGYIAVQGSGSLRDFCIEEREHRNGAIAQKGVTWAQAISICSAAGSSLCSDSQWVRACESSPSGQTFPYGSIETGSLDDSLAWLKSFCLLGTGDSAGLAAKTSDPRCVSGWGVFDLPGGVAEWTRDVYHTNPGSHRDTSNLAWIDTSDLTRKADLGTIRGGSWLLLDQPNLTLASARCRERNYPAFSGIFDSLPGGSVRRHPNPLGFSNGVGFRCCRPAGI